MAGKSEEFVEMRDARDATLGMPRLIVPSLQVNMRAGHMPPPDAHGDVMPENTCQQNLMVEKNEP